jgi:hypothetical protein
MRGSWGKAKAEPGGTKKVNSPNPKVKRPDIPYHSSAVNVPLDMIENE